MFYVEEWRRIEVVKNILGSIVKAKVKILDVIQ